MNNFLSKTFFCALAAMTAFSPAANANDGVFYTSGNQLVPAQEEQISVRKEVLTIRINKDETAMVDVCYEFFNPGQDTCVTTVGFVADAPQNFTQEQLQSTSHPFIRDFSVVMNNAPLPFHNAVVANDSAFKKHLELKPLNIADYEEDESGSGNYFNLRDTYLGTSIAYVYYFQARFAPGVNKVHHRYTYLMSKDICTQYKVFYKLTPAMRWANRQIDDFTLKIEGDGMPLHFFVNKECLDGLDAPEIENTPAGQGYGKWRIRTIRQSEDSAEESSVYEFSIRGAVAKCHIKNFKPKAELTLLSADCSESGIPYKVDPCRKYVCIIAQETPLAKTDEMAAKHFPEAMQGDTFKNKKLQEYFNKRWWYMPRK